MNRMQSLALASALVLAAVPAQAQAQAPRRTATLPPQPVTRQPPARHPHVPMHVRDGHVIGRFGAYDRVIPSCAAYTGGGYRGDIGPAPQMGTNAAPPNANGLPPAPGLSPVPGLSPAPGASSRPGTSAPVARGREVGTSRLEPLHSGWRTAGTAYVEGVCYIQDAYGSLHLIYL